MEDKKAFNDKPPLRNLSEPIDNNDDDEGEWSDTGGGGGAREPQEEKSNAEREEKAEERPPKAQSFFDENFRFGFKSGYSSSPANEQEEAFKKQLKDVLGLVMNNATWDHSGDSLFRAVSYLLYGRDELHAELRGWCYEYLGRHRDRFQADVAGDAAAFQSYLQRGRVLGAPSTPLEVRPH
jgi:hypothetical protein